MRGRWLRCGHAAIECGGGLAGLVTVNTGLDQRDQGLTVNGPG
jgi:hypothetical protein